MADSRNIKMTQQQIESFEKAKTVLKNYRRMKTEIAMLNKSIEFHSKNIQNAIDDDIDGMSVSHPAENTGGFNPNVSADKVVNIVCNMDRMKAYYKSEISALQHKQNVFSYIVSSIELYISLLDEEQAEIFKLYYYNKRPNSEIAEIKKRSEKGIRNIIKNIVFDYAITANCDFDMAIQLLK